MNVVVRRFSAAGVEQGRDVWANTFSSSYGRPAVDMNEGGGIRRRLDQ